MADNFKRHETRLESPLTDGEVADFTSSDHVFATVPRALNVSGDGTLYVNMGSLVNTPITVTKGLNPYRITAIKSVGSDSLDVVGMF